MSAVIQHEESTTTPTNLLQIAVEKGASVEQLEKLITLHERWDRENARKDYCAARAKFQGACPTIKKDREVAYGNTKYQYATLSGITSQVRDTLESCGLTYRWEIKDRQDGGIEVTCILSHISGHSESNTMSAAPDDSGAKNDIQQRGSTVSYLQRYTLIGALGIASAVEDDDGGSTGATNVETLRRHNELVREHFDTIAAIKLGIATDNYDSAVEAWQELSQDDQRGLWVAPTKGGIFTTHERTEMKSDDWGAARRRVNGVTE